ncbi:MAG: hypothetical protein U0670_02595 [Anaerolineae bacterium]
MTYKITQLPNEPIIIAKFTEPFDSTKDTTGVALVLADTLNKITGKLYYIADLQDVQIQFSDLVIGLAEAYANKASPYSNPRLTTFTVASDMLIEMGAKAASEQQQYGNADVKFYAKVDDALAVIRGQMADSSKSA